MQTRRHHCHFVLALFLACPCCCHTHCHPRTPTSSPLRQWHGAVCVGFTPSVSVTRQIAARW